MANYHDAQEVCLNGHQITSQYHGSPENRREFCPQCGAKTMHQCAVCKEDILGYHHMDGVVSLLGTPVPSHCAKCGNRFPWATKPATPILASLDKFALVEKICNRFHLVVRQLRSRHGGRAPLVIQDRV